MTPSWGVTRRPHPGPSMRSLLRSALPALLLLVTAAPGGDPPPPWGAEGHVMAARAAVERLPLAMPDFFRAAGAELAWLDPEPDRWRSRDLQAMDQAFAYDHYIDLENVPEGALESTDRWRFVAALYRAGVVRPERDVGFLPYRIEELYQRLLSGFRRWRAATDDEERRWIEARIVADAGILGHYVTDGSQPHHTTIHFNGWNASGAQEAPNPEGFTTERDFHGRFESDFVRAHVRYGDVLSAVDAEVRALGEPADVRSAIHDYLRRTHAEVAPLYRLEKAHRFEAEGAAPRTHVDFAAVRIAAGATLLRDLWWSAWIDSARPVDPGP